MSARRRDRELKKGSAELLVLSLVEARARHGYEIGKLIDDALGRHAALQHRVALSAALPAREARLDRGRWVEKAGAAPPPLLPAHAGRTQGPRRPAQRLAQLRRGHQPHHEPRACLSRTQTRDDIDARLAALGVAAGPPRRHHRRDRAAPAGPVRRAAADGRSDAEARRLALADLEEPTGWPRELARIERRPTSTRPCSGRRGGPSWATSLAGPEYALRSHASESRCTRSSSSDAGARHRRERRDLQRDRRGHAAAVRLSRHRPHRRPGTRRTRAAADDVGLVADFQDWLAQNQSFEYLGIYRSALVNLDRRDSRSG